MRFFPSLSDSNETWWVSTTIGPNKGGGHFEVIGGQIMRIFSSLSDFNENWWMWTTFGPDKGLERIVRLIRNLAHMYSIENSRMGSKVGVAAMLGLNCIFYAIF